MFDDDVPIPPPARKGIRWKLLEVGQSVAVYNTKITTIKGKLRFTGRKFTIRKIGMDGYRIWRIR